MIGKCTCVNKYQDEKYGVGNRVMNPKKMQGRYVCTVCSKEHTINVKESKEEKKDAKDKTQDSVR